MKPLAPGRIRCCVPYCGRSFKADGDTETMCGRHWRMGPKGWRQRRARLLRAYRAAIERADFRRADRLGVMCHDLWERIKARAIGVAMGFGG